MVQRKKIKCGKFKVGSKVHCKLDITKKVGNDIHLNFDGVVDACRNGVYRVHNPKNGDYLYAAEHELKIRKR
jgi:hypothetical protein